MAPDEVTVPLQLFVNVNGLTNAATRAQPLIGAVPVFWRGDQGGETPDIRSEWQRWGERLGCDVLVPFGGDYRDGGEAGRTHAAGRGTIGWVDVVRGCDGDDLSYVPADGGERQRGRTNAGVGSG